MPVLSQVIAEISNSSEYLLVHQTMHLPGIDLEGMKASMCNSICTMLATVPGAVGAQDALDWSKAVQVSAFNDAQKAQMSKAIHTKMTSTPLEESSLVGHDKQCFVTEDCLLSYYTENDWKKFNDMDLPWDADTKVNTAVMRLVMGNFWKPTDGSCAAVVCTLASCVWSDEIDNYSLYQGVHKVKQCFASADRKASRHLPVLRVWPRIPQSLPADTFQAMYQGEDQPVTVQLPHWHLHRPKVSCRNSNKHVRNAVGKQSSAVVSNNHMNNMPMHQNPMAQMFLAAQSVGLTPMQMMQLGACMGNTVNTNSPPSADAIPGLVVTPRQPRRQTPSSEGSQQSSPLDGAPSGGVHLANGVPACQILPPVL